MAATFNTANAYTLAEFAEFYDDDGKLSTLINLLKQDNPILDHALWKQGNREDGHKAKMVTKLPTVSFRKLYGGTPYSKSGIATVKEPTRQIASRWGVDVDEMQMYEGSDAQNAFRFQEGENHIEAMRQFAVNQMIYGNPDADADQLRGLAARMPYKDSPNVIDGEGTGTGCTSMYGVVWGDNEFFGFFPKNMKAGIQHEDLGRHDAYDENGDPYRAVGDEWKWNMGFFLKDWRCAVRICNLKVAYLNITDDTDANYIDLRVLTIRAKNKIPSGKRGRLKWYVSEAVMNALEIHAGSKNQIHLRYGEWEKSSEILKLHGKPVFECDAISENESALIATP